MRAFPRSRSGRFFPTCSRARKALPALKYPKNVELVAQNYDRLKPVLVPEGPPQQQQGQGQGTPPRQQQQPPRR